MENPGETTKLGSHLQRSSQGSRVLHGETPPEPSEGPTSFDDLKTVDGVICETFEEAAQKLGILESDAHWDNALTEVSATMMPRAMRVMFAVMISECNLSQPLQLWMKFREALSHDILHQERLLNPDAEFDDRIATKALIWIENKVLDKTG